MTHALCSVFMCGSVKVSLILITFLIAAAAAAATTAETFDTVRENI